MNVDDFVDAIKSFAGDDEKCRVALTDLAYAIQHHKMTRNSGHFEIHFLASGRVSHWERKEKNHLSK